MPFDPTQWFNNALANQMAVSNRGVDLANAQYDMRRQLAQDALMNRYRNAQIANWEAENTAKAMEAERVRSQQEGMRNALAQMQQGAPVYAFGEDLAQGPMPQGQQFQPEMAGYRPFEYEEKVGLLAPFLGPEKYLEMSKPVDPYKDLPGDLRARMSNDPRVQAALAAEDARKERTARAGATVLNTGSPQISKSLSGEIGKNLSAEKIKVEGALKMYDAADRIEQAIATGNVTAGPFADKLMKANQFIYNMTGGKKDEIMATRGVIKSLAEMALEARKELQGQGQVTESEAAAATKAMSGDINDLTVPELSALVSLAKKAARYRGASYTETFSVLEQQYPDEAPFYRVRGLDTLTAPQEAQQPVNQPKPPRQSKPGMKWQRNTRTGEWREVRK